MAWKAFVRPRTRPSVYALVLKQTLLVKVLYQPLVPCFRSPTDQKARNVLVRKLPPLLWDESATTSRRGNSNNIEAWQRQQHRAVATATTSRRGNGDNIEAWQQRQHRGVATATTSRRGNGDNIEASAACISRSCVSSCCFRK